LPNGWRWAVFADIKEGVELLSGKPVTVNELKEGTIIQPYEPILEIECYYQDFALFEIALHGVICQASGIVTAAT
jgi:nicotinate phosphoribosyltransferase